MHIQLRHGKAPEVGQGDFWILSCALWEEKDHTEDVPTVNLCIKHQMGGGAYEKVLVYFDEFNGGESRVIVTEDAYAEMVSDLLAHEDWPSDAAAADHLAGKYATDEYCRVAWGWDPLKKAEELRKRWEAIKLLVNPHITL